MLGDTVARSSKNTFLQILSQGKTALIFLVTTVASMKPVLDIRPLAKVDFMGVDGGEVNAAQAGLSCLIRSRPRPCRLAYDIPRSASAGRLMQEVY